MLFGNKKNETTLEKIIQDIEQNRQRTDIQKWEYLFVAFDAQNQVEFINDIRLPFSSDRPKYFAIGNQMGELGWELISFRHNMMTFKRPK
jgi:hypothetical protein